MPASIAAWAIASSPSNNILFIENIFLIVLNKIITLNSKHCDEKTTGHQGLNTVHKTIKKSVTKPGLALSIMSLNNCR